MDSKQVNYDFAKAWDLSQGNFAQSIAENILKFAEENKIKITSVYDICCGASNLLGVFKERGLQCYGTETREGMFEYSKEKHPEINYFLTENMYDVPGRQKVDLITCTHDVVNYFEKFEDWEDFFKAVEKHLNKKGMFVFDFYTKFKLKNWNETTFKSNDNLDCLMNVKSGVYDKTVITYTYYINYENYFVKTKDVVVESYFENNAIFEALRKAGFKKIVTVDHNLVPTDPSEYIERIHVVAMKK